MKVGCVLVSDGHVISTGYNGSAKGDHNCSDVHKERGPEHSDWSNKFEIHSEMNAIIHCPVSTYGMIAYVTHSPCWNCTKHLVAAGAKSIHFMEMYYRMDPDEWSEVIDYCKRMGVTLVQWKDSFLPEKIWVSKVEAC
jgi:dCMP deaminase